MRRTFSTGCYGDASTGVFKPVISKVIAQQGATFNWSVNNTGGQYSFDRFARPLHATAASSLGYSAAQSRTYFDLDAKWVLGLPLTYSINSTLQSQTYYNVATALPTQIDRFGQRRQSFTHRADGTIETITDNLANTTTLGNWKRGVPQSITFFDGSTQSSVVDDNGWVTSTTNEVGGTTSYGYDGLGRITSIGYPVDAANPWAPTSRTFAPTASAEYGLPAGTWKQTVSTGNFRRNVWFDNLWQPLLLREWDANSPATTERFVRTIHGWRGNLLYKTYAVRGISDIIGASYGVLWTFDALNRLVREDAGAKSNNTLTTRYAFESSPPFQTRVTNPRGVESTMQFFALDEPSDAFPTRVDRGVNRTGAEQSATVIARDIWGKVLSMQRSGNGTTAIRTMLYDTEQRLCQLVEPESAAVVMAYDLGGNLAWSAEGRPSQITCDAARNAVPSADRIVRQYDRRNRLTGINYPETPNLPTPDATFGYTPDGQLALAAAGNVQWEYEYNSLRRPELESMNFGGRVYRLDWQYDTHGAVSGLVYPNGETATFNPTALGQASQSGAFATGATYHPSGATAGWTFGNGIVRSATENARALPDRLRDVGGSVVFDEDYDYDENGNVVLIADARDPLQTRTLGYDAQDRLTSATGPWGSGTLTYDGADNLKTQVIGAKSYTYAYINQKLSSISVTGGAFIGFQYDGRGNQIGKNSQAFQWDVANRISVATGKSRYRYDAHGRRVLIEALNGAGVASGERTVQVYSKSGVLLYEERSTATASNPNAIFADSFEAFGQPPTDPVAKTTYHYLGSALVARKDTSAASIVSTSYLHTDFLGSVVAETNPSQVVTRRTSYQPFGLPGGTLTGGPGYTGHVFDPGVALTYMQGRYYDPDVGRFLSMDPNPPSMADGLDFNRYAYVRNNPYRNVDPDGRVVETVWDVANIGIGIVSFGKNVATGNIVGAAVDAVGVAVDVVATVVPGVPGGAGTAIKVARAGETAADAVSDASKVANTSDATELAAKAAQQRGLGCIYCVKGDKTSSGKDYVGSTDDMSRRKLDSSDGRDRTGAEIVDTYPKGDRPTRRSKEQRAMNERGGVNKLDNKRNEVSPNKWESMNIEKPK
jgi:RHS repeat-associated protein